MSDDICIECQSDAVKECAESVFQDNPDLTKSQAFAICQAQENKGELSEVSFEKALDEEDPCWDGYVMVGTKIDQAGNEVPNCVPEEDADPANLAAGCPDGQVNIGDECVPIEEVEGVPPSVLNSAPRVMAARGLDTDPITRDETGQSEVTYRNLRLLTEGVWTDQKSKTPTLYPEDGIENIEAQYPDAYAGPPVNVMHDVDPETGAVHEPSHGGYVAPDSLRFESGALMGDIVLDTSTAAGEFADENLQSALENNGQVGFGGPSVELDLDPEKHIHASEHPRAEKEISGGYLTGLGLVMEPADTNVDFAKETRQRAVAMGGDSPTDKALCRRLADMDAEEVRDTLEEHGVDTSGMDDADVVEIAESLHDDLMGEMDGGEMDADADTEEADMATHGDDEMGAEDDEDEDDEDDEKDMMGAMDLLEEEIDELWEKLREIEDQMASGEEMSAMKEELAAADTVEEIEARLAELESQPTDPKTLAADSDEDDEFELWANAEGMPESGTRPF